MNLLKEVVRAISDGFTAYGVSSGCGLYRTTHYTSSAEVLRQSAASSAITLKDRDDHGRGEPCTTRGQA